jgi:hypothetical protein
LRSKIERSETLDIRTRDPCQTFRKHSFREMPPGEGIDKEYERSYNPYERSYSYIGASMATRTSRGVRKEQIVKLVLSQDNPINTYQLNKLTDLAYSTKFVALVMEVWREGLIAGYALELPNKKTAYYWHDPKKSIPTQPGLGI